MKMNVLAIASSLSDAELLSTLPRLAARSREDTVALVAHLAELETRGIYLAEGHGSIFDYCTAVLRLSEHGAYNRLVAARVARQFPLVLDGLADGSLNLTTLRLLAPHLTKANHRDVLARAAGRSKREVEKLVAAFAPQPDVSSSIRRLPAPIQAMPERSAPKGPAESPAHSEIQMPDASAPPAGGADPVSALPFSQQPPTARPIVAPLSPARYRLQFTVGAETYEDLRLLQDLLRREIPDGDPGQIFARALKLLRAHVAREKTAATSAPRARRKVAPGSRHIPASVKRAVWVRDGGQCAFVGRAGRRCAERSFLELHHIQPFATGGEAAVGNISLRCRRHNVHEAELVFGIKGSAFGQTDTMKAGAHERQREVTA